MDDLNKDKAGKAQSAASAGGDAVTQHENGEEKKEKYILYEDAKYYPYHADFIDEEDCEQRFVFHFRRPGRAHMLQIANAPKNKAYDAQKEVLVQLNLPAERERLRVVMDEYIPLAGSFADEVFRRAGAGSVFAGK